MIQTVLVGAGGWEEELDAVAANAVVACEQGRVPDGADLASRVAAALHADDDLHDVPGVAPHRRVVGVVDEMVLHRHDDLAGSILLA